MGASIDLASLRERVRDALDMLRVVTFDGLTVRKTGAETWTGECPFHAEKTGSFVVGGPGWKRGRAHCFGCGWDGDIFDYWEERRNVDHLEAVKQLAGLGGVYVGEIQFEKPKAGVARQPEKRLASDDDRAKKPSLPSLWQAKEDDCRLIAEGRGLPFDSVWIAARVHKRVAVVRSWPLRELPGGRWLPKDGWEQHRCWTIIDETRNVAEFRRLDNGLHTRRNGEAVTKVWSTSGKSWPVGAAGIGDRKRVLLVEGGPDLLAGYHFLRMWHTPRRPLLHDVAVVCMLGASNRIREDALPLFHGCRVRIMVDADLPKDDPVKAKRKLTGMEAARRWSLQLIEHGAAVECYYVGDIHEADDVRRWHEGEIPAAEIRVIEPGFKKPDGSAVKDVNDLALCSEDVTMSDEVREAFTVWDF